MANTRTVGASGADHTTIGSALSWMQSNHNFGTDGIATIEIIDSAEYNENITISGISGTPSATAYLKLTVSSGNRHSGAAGTGHARIRGSSNGSHVITVSTDYTVIEYLEIQQDSTGSSDEGVRITSGVNDVVISRCVIWTDQNVSDQDGIYAGNWECSANVDNCIIYGFNRGGIDAQFYLGTGTQTWNVDSCTIYDCGADDTTGDGGIINDVSAGPGATVAINVYNTAVLDCGRTNSADYVNKIGGTNTWTGTNNADTDGSLTTVGITTNAQQNLTTSATTQSSGSYFVVNSLTAGSEDLTLLDDAAGNLAYGNGTDRSGSEPDSRQDLSLDIAGNTRSTTSPSPDIGASEYTTGGAFTLVAASGAYTVSGTSVNLLFGARLDGNSGALSYTGTSIDLNSGYSLTADSGSYSYAGDTTSLVSDRLLTAGSGSYSSNGTAAGIYHGRLLSADAGSYAYSGTDVTLTFASAGNFVLSANSGAYSFNGSDVDLLASFVLPVVTDSYSYSGSSVDFNLGFTLSAESASYNYTGSSIALSLTIRLNAESGNYVYNGNNATLRASGQVWTVQADSVTTWTEQTNTTTNWNIQ